MQCVQLQVTAPADPPRWAVVSTPLSAPAAHEVQVAVVAASVNPIDVRRATGYGQRLLSLKQAGRFPLVLGNDFVGDIVALGDQVQGFAVGDRVIGLRPTGGRGGAHASALNVDVQQVRRLPAGADPVASCTLPYSYTTMRLALAGAGITADRARGLRVLVHGASGALGQLALPTLQAWGAEVTAICRTAQAQTCLALGARHIVDRTDASWRALPATLDATLNFAHWDDEPWLLQRLRPGALGHACTVHPLLGRLDRQGWLGGAWQAWRDFSTHRAIARGTGGPACRYAWTVFRPGAQALDDLVATLAQAPWGLSVGLRVPLAEGQRAFSHMASGGPGRAVLLCGGVETCHVRASKRPESDTFSSQASA